MTLKKRQKMTMPKMSQMSLTSQKLRLLPM